MASNFTDKYQFSTILTLNNEHVEMVNVSKLPVVIISDNLKWDDNTDMPEVVTYSHRFLSS